MKLKSKVKFADKKLKKSFSKLSSSKSEEKQLYVSLIKVFKDLEENAFLGIQIPKRQIPKEYLQKYGIGNCWKYNLPNGWRLIYAVERDEVIVLTIVLEWMNHKKYEKRFGYN